jgi:hypothetical protein
MLTFAVRRRDPEAPSDWLADVDVAPASASTGRPSGSGSTPGCCPSRKGSGLSALPTDRSGHEPSAGSGPTSICSSPAATRRRSAGSRPNDQLTVEAVNSFLDRCQADGAIKTNQTRKHHERAIKALTRWGHTTERLDRDSLARLDVTYVDEERDVVHTRSEFTLEEVSQIIQAATGASPLAGLTGRQRALL